MNNPFAQLAFVCLFHLIGGIAIGSALRGLRSGFSTNTIFFLVWGSIFGCVPLAVGWNEFGKTGGLGFFALELGVLVAAILIAALMPDTLVESLKSPQVAPIAFGGLFVAIGIGVGAIMAQSDLLPALFFGSCFAGAGGLVFVSGLTKLLKS